MAFLQSRIGFSHPEWMPEIARRFIAGLLSDVPSEQTSEGS
jgi:hypothetical protein